jgi:hypothetical protein
MGVGTNSTGRNALVGPEPGSLTWVHRVAADRRTDGQICMDRQQELNSVYMIKSCGLQTLSNFDSAGSAIGAQDLGNDRKISEGHPK